MRVWVFSFFIFFFSTFILSAQIDKTFVSAFFSLKDDNSKVDSLNLLCSMMDDDENVIACEIKVKALAEKLNYSKGLAQAFNNIGNANYHIGKGQEALKYHLQALKIREELLTQVQHGSSADEIGKTKKDISSSYNNIGNAYQLSGDKKQAIANHIKALGIREEIKDTLAMGRSLNNIASAYLDVPDYYRAIDYGFKAVKLYDAKGDKSGNYAKALNNIGSAYDCLKEFEKALDYYAKALVIQKELGDREEIAKLLDNIAIIYHQQGQDTAIDKTVRVRKFHSALENYSKALDILSGNDNNDLTALVYNNIGNTYWELNDFPNAFIALNKSLDIYKKLDNKSGTASALNSLGVHFSLQKKFDQSIRYALQALPLADSIQDPEQIKNSCEILSNGYRETKQFEKSLFYYTRYSEAKDKLTNVEGAKKLVQEESRMIFEKQEQQLKAEQDKERIKAEEKSQRQKIIIWSVVGGLLLVVVFSIFVLNRWRITQKQKKIIELQKVEVERQRELADSRRIIAEEQKHVIEIQKTEVEKQKAIVDEQKKLVEQHNKDITDSIHYASRIQRALLTSDDYIGNHLPEYFILFKPKDIVSGDFYWAFAPLYESVGKKTFFIACCDCTGHGVPGAFMSLLNISFLNEALIEKELRDTDRILNDVRSNVIRALNPDGKGEAKDGMDSVFCSLDLKNNIRH